MIKYFYEKNQDKMLIYTQNGVRKQADEMTYICLNEMGDKVENISLLLKSDNMNITHEVMNDYLKLKEVLNNVDVMCFLLHNKSARRVDIEIMTIHNKTKEILPGYFDSKVKSRIKTILGLRVINYIVAIITVFIMINTDIPKTSPMNNFINIVSYSLIALIVAFVPAMINSIKMLVDKKKLEEKEIDLINEMNYETIIETPYIDKIKYNINMKSVYDFYEKQSANFFYEFSKQKGR